jgi:hypothetical protein
MSATNVLGAVVQSKFATLEQVPQFISLTFLGLEIGDLKEQTTNWRVKWRAKSLFYQRWPATAAKRQGQRHDPTLSALLQG